METPSTRARKDGATARGGSIAARGRGVALHRDLGLAGAAVVTIASAFRLRDALLLALLALVWGNSFLLIKIAVATVPPIWIVAFRMTAGGLLLLLIATALRRSIPRDGSTVAVLGFLGAVGAALPWSGQAWAQRFLDSGLVAVLNSFTPVATLVIALVAGQERLYRNRVLGLLVAIFGTLVVVGGEIGSGRSIWALAVTVLATAGYGLAGVVTRARISGRVAPLPAAAVQLSLGAAVLLPMAWSLNGPMPSNLGFPAIAALLALGLFGTGVAFIIYNTLIESVGATNASMVTYVIPVVGLASGALVRGERFGVNVFVGAAALIGGVWLAQRAPSA
jgi:drug/metabolite transporter (DMT)-like permease